MDKNFIDGTGLQNYQVEALYDHRAIILFYIDLSSVEVTNWLNYMSKNFVCILTASPGTITLWHNKLLLIIIADLMMQLVQLYFF